MKGHNMRSDWKMLLGITVTCYALLGSNCMTMYRIRSPEEISELNQEIEPLPDTLLLIPEFDGIDTIPILYFETHGCWEPLTSHMIYNNGKYEFMQKERGVFISGYIEMSDIQDLIVGLNQMGFFNVSNESIQKKKFIEYRGCCLGLFFGGLASEPWKTCATTHTIEIELPNIEHHISYYDIAYHAEIYPTLQDLQIL